jgi:DNA helicase MCM8
MLEALRNGRIPIDKDHIEEYGFVELSFDVVRRELCTEDLIELYNEHPDKLIQALGLAVCEVAYEHESIAKQVHARLIPSGNVKPTPFRALKAALIGKMLVVRGNVVKATSIRPKVTQLAFMCLRCLQTHPHRILEGVFRNPPRCPTNGCPSRQFRPERDSVDTHCVNWQKIKIQEVVDDLDEGDGESGRVPRTVEVELEDDLVDAVAPGDIVTVHGLLKAADVSEGKAQISPAYSVFIGANWIRKEKDDIQNSSSAETDALIRSLSNGKDVVPLLVSSFCPSIYGHVLVKFGILLTLFGGSQRGGGGSRAKQSFSIRTDPHLLLLGDPGLGKSQLITAAAAIAPRGLYVCGNTCTASGLTATLQHEGSSGEYGLEAGALVLADRGACCIDEFDKVGDPAVLLDVMEQQQVNVAKAGIVCALPARTSVIAAANPIGGHYK